MTLGTNKIVAQKYKAVVCCVTGGPSSQDERPYTSIITGFFTVEIIFNVVKGKTVPS